MANNFTGRQIIINTTGAVGPACNMKITEAKWQDITAAGQTFSFTDAAGRAFSFTSYAGGGAGIFTLDIGKLDWVEGPITVTQIDSGNVYMILGYK